MCSFEMMYIKQAFEVATVLKIALQLVVALTTFPVFHSHLISIFILNQLPTSRVSELNCSKIPKSWLCDVSMGMLLNGRVASFNCG